MRWWTEVREKQQFRSLDIAAMRAFAFVVVEGGLVWSKLPLNGVNKLLLERRIQR